MGAVGLLVLHIGILVLRKYHHFAKDSAGEALASIFWLLWLVIPVVIGNMAVAEERRLGVMEGQLCLPVSRRTQFVIKGVVTLFLGIFLGGVMPMLLEITGMAAGAPNLAFMSDNRTIESGIVLFALGTLAFSMWLALVGFFASTLAKTFLQAIGFAIVTFTGWAMLISGFAVDHRLFYSSFSQIPSAARHLDTDHYRHPALAGVFELQKLPRRLDIVAAQHSWRFWSVGFYRREQRGDFQPRVGSF